MQKITNAEFIFNNRVNLISPSGKPVKGYGFIRDLQGYDITSLITDDKLHELGRATMGNPEQGISWLTVKNLTTPNSEMPIDFMPPLFKDFARSAKDGYFKHVATEAYNILINYLRKSHEEIKELRANARSQQSWDFHKIFGFSDKQNGEYNSYAFMNELYYKL